MRRELYAGINRTTKPLREQAQQAALRDLPQRGGLAATVAKRKPSTRSRGGANPRVTIIAKGAGASTDKGFVRHPVFNTGRWVVQKTKGAGWFTETLRQGAPTVRKELLDVIKTVARKVRG